MTKDRQKKSLHHNKTSREYGGGIRGLAGLPWVAAEVPERYFSNLRSRGSKLHAGLHSL